MHFPDFIPNRPHDFPYPKLRRYDLSKKKINIVAMVGTISAPRLASQRLLGRFHSHLCKMSYHMTVWHCTSNIIIKTGQGWADNILVCFLTWIITVLSIALPVSPSITPSILDPHNLHFYDLSWNAPLLSGFHLCSPKAEREAALWDVPLIFQNVNSAIPL